MSTMTMWAALGERDAEPTKAAKARLKTIGETFYERNAPDEEPGQLKKAPADGALMKLPYYPGEFGQLSGGSADGALTKLPYYPGESGRVAGGSADRDLLKLLAEGGEPGQLAQGQPKQRGEQGNSTPEILPNVSSKN